jgi:DNA-binding GntR family transcriptional regulator
MVVVSLAISRASGVPLHLQIRRALQEAITSGRLAPGTRLPTEQEYARQFSVSIAPVRQALLDLADAGLVTRQKGKGTFVREARVEAEIDLLTSFTDSLRSRGVPVRMQVLALSRDQAEPTVAAALGVREGTMVVHLRRLAWIATEPAAILDAWLPATRFADLADYTDFDAGRSLYATLEHDFDAHLGLARSRIEVVRSSEEEAHLLGLGEGATLVRVTSVTQDTVGRVVEAAWISYRADRFVFTMTSLRGSDASVQIVASPAHVPG